MAVNRSAISAIVCIGMLALPGLAPFSGADYIGPRIKIDYITNSVTAGGSAAFAVTVFNETGVRVQGATVSVSAPEGSFDAASKPTGVSGTASFMFTAPAVVAEAHGVVVSATATYGSPPYYSANMTFWVSPAAAQMQVQVSGPSSVQMGAGPVRYNVTVTAGGSPVAGAEITPGDPDKGTVSAGSGTTDDQGKAWFNFTPPADLSGQVNLTVTATCSTFTSAAGHMLVTITGGGQPSLTVTVSSDRAPLPCWGSCNLTASVNGTSGAILGAIVDWSVSKGWLSALRSTTDIQGRALVQYTAAGDAPGLWSGTVNVTAGASYQGSSGEGRATIAVAPYAVTWHGNLSCKASEAKLAPGEALIVNASIEMPPGTPYEFITPLMVKVEVRDANQTLVNSVVLGQNITLQYGLHWSCGPREVLVIPRPPTALAYTWTVKVMSQNALYTYYQREPVGLDVLTAGADDWTFLIFLNGDSNLAEWASYFFNQLETEAPAGEFRVLVQWDTIGAWQGSRRYEMVHDDDTTTINSVLVGEIPEQNSGDAEVLYDFLAWGAARAPAGRYCVVIWDHGGGYAGSSWDFSSNNSRFDNSHLAASLARFASEERKVSVLVFDACLMSSMEVAYQFRNVADFVVGAELPITGDILRPSAMRAIRGYYPGGRPTPLQLCHELLEGHNGTPAPHFPLTVMDMGQVSDTYEAMNALADALLEKWGSVGECVFGAASGPEVRNPGPYKDTMWLADMRSYLVSLMASIDAQPMSYRLAKCTEMAQRLIDRLDAMVVDEVNTGIGHYRGVNLFATGGAIYLHERDYYLQNGLPPTSGWVRLFERLFPPDASQPGTGTMNITDGNFNIIQEDNDADGLIESLGGDLVVAGSQIFSDGLVVMDFLGSGGNRGSDISNLSGRQVFSLKKGAAASYHFTITSPLADAVEVVVTIVGAGGRLQDQFLLGMFMMDAVPTTGSPPTVSISAGGPTITAGKQLQLVATASDPDGDALSIWWDFDDSDAVGLDAAGASANTSYRGSGNRTITCIVSDGRNIAVARATIQVLPDPANRGPVANLTFAFPDAANYLKVRLNGSGSSDPDGDAMEFSFNFGDGQWTGWSTERQADHAYASNGTYDCILRVRDPSSYHGVAVLVPFEVRGTPPNRPPVPALNLSTSKARTGEKVTALLSCTDPDGLDTVQFRVDWGDGNLSDWTASTTLTHSFAKAGTYDVTLTARDGGDLTGRANATILVVNKPVSVQPKGTIPGPGLPAVLAVVLCVLVPGMLRRASRRRGQ